jgi:GrpB-like predicted nucleotidyltransferase (UPF0157 family)
LQTALSWDWLNSTNPASPIGEFSAVIPAGLIRDSNDNLVHFIVSGMSWGTRSAAADDDVELVDYDSSWPERFNTMKARLLRILPEGFTRRIDHYGSTAIPGMPAKPVIDILIEIPSFHEARRVLIPLFNNPEYEYWWYNDHMTFIVRDGFLGRRTAHIHAATKGHPVWEGLFFCDYLINHPSDAARYAELKRQLAENYVSDRETYTDRKYEFVREISNKALKKRNENA